MDTLLVRLKPYDSRRGHMLRRYTYAGIKFQEERGWYRVEKPVAEYLRGVHEVPNDRFSPLAFDVCTEVETKTLESSEVEELKIKRSATDDLRLVPARPPLLGGDTPTKPLPAKEEEKETRRSRRERE